jgi:hypothetical protein
MRRRLRRLSLLRERSLKPTSAERSYSRLKVFFAQKYDELGHEAISRLGSLQGRQSFVEAEAQAYVERCKQEVDEEALRMSHKLRRAEEVFVVA